MPLPLAPSPPLANPLVLIGASVRAAAQDAAAAGYRCIAIDQFGDRDLRAVCQHWFPLDDQSESLRPLSRWPAAPIVPTGGFYWPRDPRLLAGRLVAYPDPATLAALTDPQRLQTLAQGCGIHFPLTHCPTNCPSTHFPQTPGQRWLLKPRFGSGGVGIRRWDPAADSLASLISDSQPQRSSELPETPAGEPPQRWWLQRWEAGRPLGASYFARQRRGRRRVILLGACSGLTHRRHPHWPWLYGGSLGPGPLATDCREQLQRMGEQTATTFSLCGLFNIDFIRRPDGDLVLLEINPRYSASMELLSGQTGKPVSLIDAHLAAYQEAAGHIDAATADQRTAALWQLANPQTGAAVPPACKRIVYATAAMRVPLRLQQALPQWLPAASHASDLRVSLHDLPADDQPIAAGHPALTLIVRGGDDAKRLLRHSRRLAAELCQRLPVA